MIEIPFRVILKKAIIKCTVCLQIKVIVLLYVVQSYLQQISGDKAMARPHIILIHGMGEHKKEDFLNDFFTPLDKAAEYFGSLQKPSNSLEVHYIDYNDVINDVRNFMKGATLDEMQSRFPGVPSIIAKINELNRKFAEADSFWFTHVLDVVIYRSFFANAIQARVGAQLVHAMQTATDAQEEVHIVCHSLGTAVGHDVLHKLYTKSLHDENGKLLLYAGLNKISSITMVANVCAVPIFKTDPYKSVVKPGPNGICESFMSCRHVLDPFASLVKFKPGSNWPNVYGSEFRNIVINRVERANVHDLDHYLNDPNVYQPFFINLYKLAFKTTAAELSAARQAHDETTIQGKFDALKTFMEDAEITLYWDPAEGEFVFSEDGETMLEKLTLFLDQLETIKGQINDLKV
jgi:hypothetical protein